MEKLIIHVPNSKSQLIKQLLKELGVAVEQDKIDKDAHLKELANMPVWSDEDLKPIEEAREAFNSIKPAKW